MLRAVATHFRAKKDADVVRAVFGERLFLEEVEAGCASLRDVMRREKTGQRSRERAFNDATAIFGVRATGHLRKLSCG